MGIQAGMRGPGSSGISHFESIIRAGTSSHSSHSRIVPRRAGECPCCVCESVFRSERNFFPKPTFHRLPTPIWLRDLIAIRRGNGSILASYLPITPRAGRGSHYGLAHANVGILEGSAFQLLFGTVRTKHSHLGAADSWLVAVGYPSRNKVDGSQLD